MGVSTLVLAAFDRGWFDGGPIQLMIPALFFFIPGDAISSAMIELSSGRITAGASRLIYSIAVLLVLAFGALVGTMLAGVPQSYLFDENVTGTLGIGMTWAGWVVFGVGVMLVFSMRPRDFGWALLVILVTAGALELGTAAYDEFVGTFIGAAVMTTVAALLARSPRRPSFYVLYLGAFYVLTPGAHGVRGFESWIGGNRIQGVEGFTDTVGLFTAIAAGLLVGLTTLHLGREAADAL